jgi:hypothetical protein
MRKLVVCCIHYTSSNMKILATKRVFFFIIDIIWILPTLELFGLRFYLFDLIYSSSVPKLFIFLLAHYSFNTIVNFKHLIFNYLYLIFQGVNNLYNCRTEQQMILQSSYVKILFRPNGKFYNWKTVYLPQKRNNVKVLGTTLNKR